MRAMIYQRYGGPEVLELADLPEPKPSARQVAIRVVTASVNPIDWKKAEGVMRLIQPARFPIVPAYDVAGAITAIGARVTELAVGMRVHARIKDPNRGACAEIALAGVDVTTEMPAAMSFADAAALPLAGMTALQGLRDGGKLPLEGARARVLVIGASGGVGHFAVQLARAMGAHVTGVCSTRNVALVHELGAHEVIDYTKEHAFEGVTPFDVVLDCVAGEPGKWLGHMTPKGRYVSCLPGPAVFARGALNITCGKKVYPVLLRPRATDLAILDRLYEAKKLRAVIDSRFPLEKLADAWARSKSGRSVGKIVIDVASA
jgi:NADPH:quinone reductase-like Zn-dependent oxidoreductase